MPALTALESQLLGERVPEWRHGTKANAAGHKGEVTTLLWKEITENAYWPNTIKSSRNAIKNKSDRLDGFNYTTGHSALSDYCLGLRSLHRTTISPPASPPTQLPPLVLRHTLVYLTKTSANKNKSLVFIRS